jgi:hypothetical protein
VVFPSSCDSDTTKMVQIIGVSKITPRGCWALPF